MVKPYYEDSSSGIVIYHGDCREVLPTVGRANLLLTDPPYGIGADKNLRANKQHGNAVAPSRDYGAGNWDNDTPPAWLLGQAVEKTDWQIVWGGNYFGLPAAKCWLVWDKDNGDNGYADCELAWTNLDKAVRKFRYRWMGMLQEHAGAAKEPRFHPTQKPLALMQWCLSVSPEDCTTILDPWMGSGTTLRAAKDAGKRAIGIEREERYCEIAANRLSQEVLFGRAI